MKDMAGGYEEEKGILVVVLIQGVEKPTPGSWKDEIYKIPECIPFFCTVTGKKVDPNHSLACEIHVGTKKML